MLRLNDILDRVSAYHPDPDLDLIKKAYVYSAKVHQGQLRKSGEPYLVHPLEVAGILAELKLDEASVVTGLLFLLATFLAPLVSVVPYEAATPALVVVGFLMMQQVRGIEWDDLEIAIPAFLTIVLMPFTYSITAGIGAGFVVFVLLKIVLGKASAVHPLMWGICAMFVLYFALDPIKSAFVG